ncbi:MAG: TonB-dependent siderophore receptor [Thioclava marina]|uniref:TonB-dependent siderophore receptor n=1 Tax=Thioclava marina TaxID=1915077 RepID=UPI0019B8012F|nr:TonB-dependent siderophore receptor [Thioclava marina]MBC7145897.1 TonB-dependent siderophore receptor [Thioclava marina]
MITWQMRIVLTMTTALCAPGAMAQDMFQLDEITVTGSSYKTEGTGSYRSGLISVGEKAAMTPREVPQSTTVVTYQQIEDGGYSALETAMEDTPGIMVLNNDVGRSSLFSRGFEFDYLYYDGLPAPVSSIYGTQPDLSIVDHIEVLKGPSGLFIGTGSPAGSVNMRLKQADRTDPGGYVSFDLDSTGHARAEADFGGKLNADGSLRGRMVVAYGDGDGFVDQQTNGVKQVYGTLAWDITPDTEATLSLSHMERDISPYNGLPSYADGSLLWIDPQATTAADWNRFDNQVTDVIAAIEHRFGAGARVKFSLRNSHQTGDFLYAYAGSAAAPDNTVSKLSWLARDFEQDSLAADLHVELPFTVGGWDGMAIVGADAQRTTSRVLQDRGAFTGSFDLEEWDVSGVARPTVDYTSATASRTDSTTNSRGLYAQTRIKPTEALTLIAGARLSWYDARTRDLVANTVSRSSEDGHVTPFAGFTYDISPATTLYASYSEIFQPQDQLDASGNVIDPLEGSQYEIGTKSEFANGLSLSAALFQLEQKNRALQPTGSSYYVAQEKVRVRGFEIEAAGEIGEHWHLAGGYTYSESKYLNGPTQGDVFSTYTPEHMFKLTAEYEVTEGVLDGWSFGGRLKAVSGFSSVSRGTTLSAPGYGVVDLTAAKQLPGDTELRLSVNNVFDKDYYSRVGGTTVFNFRGEPRSLNLSLKKRF